MSGYRNKSVRQEPGDENVEGASKQREPIEPLIPKKQKNLYS